MNIEMHSTKSRYNIVDSATICSFASLLLVKAYLLSNISIIDTIHLLGAMWTENVFHSLQFYRPVNVGISRPFWKACHTGGVSEQTQPHKSAMLQRNFIKLVHQQLCITKLVHQQPCIHNFIILINRQLNTAMGFNNLTTFLGGPSKFL